MADILATPAARRSRASHLTSTDSHRPGATNFVHIGLVVEDLDETEAGWETVGEIVDFENTFLLCYVGGPKGLIVELAERLDGAPD